MRGVMVAAEGSSGHDDPYRRLLRLHRPYLHWRSVGAQHQPSAVRPLREIECVMLLTRRVFGRDVERREVVEIFLDMWPLGDSKTHLAKDGDDLIHRLADRMDAAGLVKGYRERYIGLFGRQALSESGAAEPRSGLGERHRDPVLRGIQRDSGAPPLFWSERAEFPHRQGQ